MRPVTPVASIGIFALQKHVMFTDGTFEMISKNTIDRPVDFKEVVEHNMPKLSLVDIPPELKGILDEAKSITKHTEHKSMVVTIKRGKMQIHAKNKDVELNKTISIDKKHPTVSVRVEPKLLKAGISHFQKWMVGEKSVAMAKDNEIYLVGVMGVD